MNSSSGPRQLIVSTNRYCGQVWLFLLLLVGFWLKLAYLKTSIYHTDEFISMLATKMVAQRGLPILPSGLFYDHGLLYSLISGALVALVGFAEPIARWPVILVSVFTIAAYYAAAHQLFGSRLAGLLAAGLATFDIFMIKWGVWARGYSQAHLFILLGVTWLLISTLKRPSRRGRFLAMIFLTAALFSHTLTLFALPPLVILLLIFTFVYRRDWLRQPGLWQEAIAALFVLTLAITVVSMGHVGSTVSLQDVQANSPPPFGLEFLRGFFLPGLDGQRFHQLTKFFAQPTYQLPLYLVTFFFLHSLYRLGRHQARFSDAAFLFLASYSLLVIAEMAIFLTADWQKSIYMFFLTLPAFLLLSADSLARLLRWLGAILPKLSTKANWPSLQGRNLKALAPPVGLVLILAFWGPQAWDTVHGQTTGAYNTAFNFVGEQWQPGDRVMTEHPSAAYVYLEQNDYYANQVTAKVLDDDGEENLLIDRYTASPLIDTVDKFNAVMDSAEPLWFVVGTAHLNKYYDPLFHPQIFARMDLVRRFGETYVFRSQPYSRPIPAEPDSKLDGTFGDFIRLEGYSLDTDAILPDETTLLGLYWRPIGKLPPKPFKVFVQLRNGQGQTIAQADHFIFEETLTVKRWEKVWQENEWLRDPTYLRLPNPLPAAEGPYRIFIGLYDPDSFERVPLLNDASGEHAVVINLTAALQ